jgi:hypothetical protein
MHCTVYLPKKKNDLNIITVYILDLFLSLFNFLHNDQIILKPIIQIQIIKWKKMHSEWSWGGP